MTGSCGRQKWAFSRKTVLLLRPVGNCTSLLSFNLTMDWILVFRLEFSAGVSNFPVHQGLVKNADSWALALGLTGLGLRPQKV